MKGPKPVSCKHANGRDSHRKTVSLGAAAGLSTVDASNNGKGKFRVLITPNEVDHKWPSARYLRQSVRANGWGMVRQVSLRYEIWPQFNGFPLTVAEEKFKGHKAKPPELPKQTGGKFGVVA